MSILSPGTLCIIVGGCPENIGILVEVIKHLGACYSRSDAYQIKVVGRKYFPQLKTGPDNHIGPGRNNTAITDRHKLMPLEDPKNDFEDIEITIKKARKSVVCDVE